MRHEKIIDTRQTAPWEWMNSVITKALPSTSSFPLFSYLITPKGSIFAVTDHLYESIRYSFAFHYLSSNSLWTSGCMFSTMVCMISSDERHREYIWVSQREASGTVVAIEGLCRLRNECLDERPHWLLLKYGVYQLNVLINNSFIRVRGENSIPTQVCVCVREYLSNGRESSGRWSPNTPSPSGAGEAPLFRPM